MVRATTRTTRSPRSSSTAAVALAKSWHVVVILGLMFYFINHNHRGARCYSCALGFQPFTTTTTCLSNKHQHHSKSSSTRRSKVVLQRRRQQEQDNNNVVSLSHSSSSFSLYTTLGGGASNNNNDDKENDNNDTQQLKNKGRALLCLVALLYGTLNVSLRFVYQMDAVPPTASALSAARGWLASLCFIPLLAMNNDKNINSNIDTIKSDDAADNNEKMRESTTSKQLPLSLWKVGIELAIWNFLAQGLLNIGLISTASARASFLTQTSILITPILSLVFGNEIIRPTVWLGCAVALVGLTLLSGVGGAASATGSSLLAFSKGDWFILGGALSWSCYLFRLPRISANLDEIQVQAIKTFLLAILYSIWFLVSFWTNPAGSTMSFAWATHVVAWVALLYSAFGPGTLADVLQQQGQQHVSASEANVLLSMEPVFAALCAFLVLGEVTSFQETMGGGLILVAALIATR